MAWFISARTVGRRAGYLRKLNWHAQSCQSPPTISVQQRRSLSYSRARWSYSRLEPFPLEPLPLELEPFPLEPLPLELELLPLEPVFPLELLPLERVFPLELLPLERVFPLELLPLERVFPLELLPLE